MNNTHNAVLRAAIEWRQHAQRLRELRASKRPCEFDGYEPCWETGPFVDVLGRVTRLDAGEACEACLYNKAYVIPTIKAERARRKGLLRKLARATDRLIAEAEAEQ